MLQVKSKLWCNVWYKHFEPSINKRMIAGLYRKEERVSEGGLLDKLYALSDEGFSGVWTGEGLIS